MTINLNINQTLILFMADGPPSSVRLSGRSTRRMFFTSHRKNIHYMSD